MIHRLLLPLLLSAAAFAQSSPPIVIAIAPPSGPATGGTTVHIIGDNLSAGAVCVLPCPPRVIFGDVAVDAIEESDERLTVVTPPHEPGTVDVTIAVTARPLVTLKNAFTFTTGPETGYEKVLLPVYIEGTVPGANGSQWGTDFWIRNNGTETVRLAPWECPAGLVCPPVFPLTHALGSGQTLHNPADLFTGGRSNVSQIVYVSAPSDVSMSLRAGDVSRNTLNAGTDVPVIRENELLRNAAQLFNVPMNNPDFRVLLRIYELTSERSDFAVRLYAQTGQAGGPVHSVTLTASTPQSGPFRNEAAYAQLDVTDLLRLEKLWPAAVRIEVVPVDPGRRFWTFASATNNQTQLVTLITPQ